MVPRESTGNYTTHSNPRSGAGRTANAQNTPFTNRRVSLHQLKKGGKSTEALTALEILLRHPWSAFSVSPLFTWNSRESRLKRYSRRMSHFLAENLPVEEGEKFLVEYKLDRDLKLNGNDDPAVTITVNIAHDDIQKQVFLGYLISWGCPKAAKSEDLDGILYLPVLLCSGSKNVGNQVRHALVNIHDCVISSMELRESDRKEVWMAMLSYLQNKEETITISYMIPNHPKIGSIDLRITSDVTTRLSRLIHKKHGRDVSCEEINLFWDEINEYINDTFGMKVQYCEMVKLQLREAIIAANKFRANTARAMHVILIFLTNMSVKLESITDAIQKG